MTGDRLVSIFEALGFENVSSFQASGNILFSTESADPVDVEQALRADLGYDVPAVLRPEQVVRETSSAMPFDQAELIGTEGRIQVIPLRNSVSLETLPSACSGVRDDDVLRPHGGDVLWLPRAGISGSTLDIGGLEQRLGPVTVRTHNTIRRLVERL